MTTQPRLKTVTIHILLNISRSKSNQAIKLGQLVQGGLNKKEIQLNLCNIFSILIFNKLHLFF